MLASGVYQMNRKGGRSRRGQKECRHEPHHLQKARGGISIVQKARGWYLNNGKCIVLISKCQLLLPWIQGGER